MQAIWYSGLWGWAVWVCVTPVSIKQSTGGSVCVCVHTHTDIKDGSVCVTCKAWMLLCDFSVCCVLHTMSEYTSQWKHKVCDCMFTLISHKAWERFVAVHSVAPVWVCLTDAYPCLFTYLCEYSQLFMCLRALLIVQSKWVPSCTWSPYAKLYGKRCKCHKLAQCESERRVRFPVAAFQHMSCTPSGAIVCP